MNYLFHHRFKKISGWVFYIMVPIALYFLYTDQYEELLKIRVFSLFPSEMVVTGPGSENVIGSRGFTWIENGFLDEIFTFIIIVSGIVNSFSKEKVEDELISRIRMESLVLSLYINYGLLILSNFFIYELSYFYVMVVHLFSILLLFNLIFKYRLYKHYNS